MTSFWLTQCRKQWYILDIDIKDDHFRRNRIDAKKTEPSYCVRNTCGNQCYCVSDMYFYGGSVIGELDAVAVLRYGEYGRILSSTFLHAGIEHLFNNMVILFFLGAMIEKVTGHLQFLILYLLSGIGANICSLIYKVIAMERIASVGASGAIFGLDGVLLAWILLDRRSMPDVTPKRVILMIALSLYNGFTAQNVDNAAHVGGLLTGFLAGALLCMIRKQKRNREV